ncbi:MAG: hypothetical protein IPJ74_07505 [Saprospiraceae bacterium]|nr:hypothetical protein [Saprospiraceae bacterium]
MKKNKYFLNIILILFVISNSLLASGLNTNPCVVHLDKSFYVTGEVIWFKIYLPSESKGNPFTMRVGLLDQQGQVADYFFLQTEGKTYASGYYKIPFDRPSGIHHLVFMGQEQTSKRPIVLAKVAVPIYNDLEKLNISEITPVAKMPEKSLETNDLQIEISWISLRIKVGKLCRQISS